MFSKYEWRLGDALLITVGGCTQKLSLWEIKHKLHCSWKTLGKAIKEHKIIRKGNQMFFVE